MATRTALVLASGQQQQLQSVDVLGTGAPDYGLKNKIINGNFEFWNRGTSFATNNVYTAERWRLTSTSGTLGTRTVSKQSLTFGDITFPGSLRNNLQIACSAAGGSQVGFMVEQRIERVDTLANTTVVVSFWMKADTGRTVTVFMRQNFGTGGSPSATVDQSTQNVVLTSSWQRFSFVFPMPSVSGKTLGSAGNDYLALCITLPVNTTYTLNLTGVQVEEAQSVTDFEIRPLSVDELLCERYFKLVSTNFWALPQSTAAHFCGVVELTPKMRATPTGTLSTTTPALTQIDGAAATSGTASVLTLDAGSSNVGVGIKITGFTALNNFWVYYLTTGTISLDAEL